MTDETPARPVVISSIDVGDPRNPWVAIDAPQTFRAVQDQLDRMTVAAEIVRHARIRILHIAWVVSSEYPQYFLIKRGAIGRGKDCSYLVSLREESIEGLTLGEMERLYLRAAATALFDVGHRCKYPELALRDWFRALEGRDRFDLEPRVWQLPRRAVQ